VAMSRSVISKFLRLAPADQALVVEASITLLLASGQIAVLPFRYLAQLAASRMRQPEPSPEECIRIIERIRWAIITCAQRLPLRALCFEQGLAAQRMLRRRGIASVLYFGAAPDDQRQLTAHVWVRFKNLDVIGCEVAPQFVPLASIPGDAGIMGKTEAAGIGKFQK